MKNLRLFLCASVTSAGLIWAGAAAAQTAPAAAPAAPAPAPAPYPAFGPTISANGAPVSFDAGPLGKLTVSGDFSGMVYAQDNPAYALPNGFNGPAKLNSDEGVDFTNALVMVQKTDGPIQFFVAAGAYSFPTLGTGYLKAVDQTRLTFDAAPEAFVKIVPNANFSILAGQLPTLIGAEGAFTFQNVDIQRGLLWGVEPLFSKGVQLNFTEGPWALSVSWNDGFYSNELTTGSGLLSYTFKNSDVLSFAGSGNFSKNYNSSPFSPAKAPFATPLALQEGDIFNIIYSHTQGPWTITPYFQYQTVPNVKNVTPSGSSYGGAVLVKYSFTPEFSVGARGEYLTSDGKANMIFYGPGASAWSLTLTPTYQKGIFWVRGEVSYTSISGESPGFGFGALGDKSEQVRGLLEAGVSF
ncbi:MAG TPA: outer membrane beta-barrel protein [Caulobacteraceae bacterium]|nr:outer membrane beta-barrel protein [Caulobacteraceae bacterium]